MFAVPSKGQGTEYTDNYNWSGKHNTGGIGTWCTHTLTQGAAPQGQACNLCPTGTMRDPGRFDSEFYPSVYREMTVRRDERGHYIDPFKNIVSKPDGRRLIYDTDHPDKMYGSQWSSELADAPGPYSFPTTTGLDPEIPWTKDMQWQVEGEVGQWPTPIWKTWTHIAECPPYDGHDDQAEYSKYKVPI